jgi:drug/metabolite transporter (DMT)-like permease
MQNLRGIIFMLLAMAGFAVEDSLIKVLSAHFPISQILLILGFGGMVTFVAIALVQGHRLFTPKLLSWPFLIRFFSDMFAALFFISAIALIPLSTASTILQAVPIIVTMGAALFLGQMVGWRRWTAIIAGFIGVLIVIRPGFDGFEPASILALLGVVFLAVRDLATRVMAPDLSTITVSAYAFLAMALAGVIALPFFAPLQQPDAVEWGMFLCTVVLGGLAYVAVVIATRTGDIGAIAPFRYSRLIFAIIIAVIFLGERPDMPTMIGASVIVASGVYAFWRERLRAAMETPA